MDNVHFLLMNLVPKGGTRYALQATGQISLNLVASCLLIYTYFLLDVKNNHFAAIAYGAGLNAREKHSP